MEKAVQHHQATQRSGIPATGTRGIYPTSGRQCLSWEKLTYHWHHYRGQVRSAQEDFTKRFIDILVQVEQTLVEEKGNVLPTIPRSHPILAKIWPTKQDIYYGLVDKWFSDRIAFIKQKRGEYSGFHENTNSYAEIKTRLRTIFGFANANPFRNKEFERMLYDLEDGYKTLRKDVKAIKRRAKMVAEIKRKNHLELIKAELFSTYKRLTVLLKKRTRNVNVAKAKVRREAEKLGIKLST